MRLTAFLALALTVVSVAGCGPEPSTVRAAEKSGTGELRTDLDPLVKRFPELRAAEGARWMSGTFGSSRAPGPSTYWIDAVVTLPRGGVDDLESAHAPESGGQTPDVVEGLRAELPAGPFLTGDRLDRAFGHGEWSARVYLDPDRDALVLVATGS